MPKKTARDGYQIGESACKTDGCRTLVEYEISSKGGWHLPEDRATCDSCGTTWGLKLHVSAPTKASISLVELSELA
jgi:hypothetical protein